MEKSRIWRANSFRLCGICSPSKHKLILAHRPEEMRSIGPFYKKQRMGVNKSDSYIGCRRKNVKRLFGTKNACKEADRFRILVQFFLLCPFSRTIHKLRSWCWCFSTKQQINTGGSLPVPYPNLWLRFTTAGTAKTVISKLLPLNYFILFAFNGLNCFHKKTVNHFFIDVKRLLRMQKPVFVSSTVTKSFVYHRKFLGFYHKQIIA